MANSTLNALTTSYAEKRALIKTLNAEARRVGTEIHTEAEGLFKRLGDPSADQDAVNEEFQTLLAWYKENLVSNPIHLENMLQTWINDNYAKELVYGTNWHELENPGVHFRINPYANEEELEKQAKALKKLMKRLETLMTNPNRSISLPGYGFKMVFDPSSARFRVLETAKSAKPRKAKTAKEAVFLVRDLLKKAAEEDPERFYMFKRYAVIAEASTGPATEGHRKLQRLGVIS